jgi:hypothetical protein
MQWYQPSKSQAPSRFQQARDWTAFFVSITSLVTAVFALRSTFVGSEPFLGAMQGDTITVVRSDQGDEPAPLLDEDGKPAKFPLIVLQATVTNRGVPPYNFVVRSVATELAVSKAGSPLFKSDYVWYRLTSSAAKAGTLPQQIVFGKSEQASPFGVLGGTTWSHEVLFIPKDLLKARAWDAFERVISQDCAANGSCLGAVRLTVRLDGDKTLTEECSFPIGGHFRNGIRGVEKNFFSTPVCDALK